MQTVSKSVTVNRPREEVYAFWRDFENLPRFLHHLIAVTRIDATRSQWRVSGPGGSTVEWEAAITEDVPGQRIAWQSLAGSDVANEGIVSFADAPTDRGTEVRVELRFDPPAGRAGVLVARLFGEAPEQQVRDDMRRFKQVMETGEVVLSEGSLQGAGEGARAERPAQPPAEAVHS